MARAMALQAIGLGFESPYLHRYGFDRSDSASADSAESDSEGAMPGSFPGQRGLEAARLLKLRR